MSGLTRASTVKVAAALVAIVVTATVFLFAFMNPQPQQSSLRLDGYDFVQAPGFEYLLANISNTGTGPGFVVQVAMDGNAYSYNGTSAPTKTASTWSMLVAGQHSQVIGVGQQAILYIDTLGICHSCTHIVRVNCSDGSYIEFSFRPW